MVLHLIKDVLSRCSKIERLSIPISWPFDELLSAVNPSLWDSQMHTLCLIRDYAVPSHKLQLPGEFLIHLNKLENPLENVACCPEVLWC